MLARTARFAELSCKSCEKSDVALFVPIGVPIVCAKHSLGEDRMQRAYWMPLPRSLWIGMGSGIGIGAIRSLAILTLFAMSPGGLGTDGYTLMIAAGANLVLGIVAGTLGARFARPGPTNTFPWAGLGGFLVALFVFYPLLTFGFDTAVTSLTVH